MLEVKAPSCEQCFSTKALENFGLARAAQLPLRRELTADCYDLGKIRCETDCWRSLRFSG